MAQLAMFSQSVLAYSPISSLSFNSRMRKVNAAGSSVTATTWTNWVMLFWTGSVVSKTAKPAEINMPR